MDYMDLYVHSPMLLNLITHSITGDNWAVITQDDKSLVIYGQG